MFCVSLSKRDSVVSLSRFATLFCILPISFMVYLLWSILLILIFFRFAVNGGMNNSNISIASSMTFGLVGDKDGTPLFTWKLPALCKNTLSILGT